MAAIAQSGISQIVSLLERSESRELGLDKEAELAERHGMEFVSYPVPDRGLPASMKDYLALTKRLYHHAAGGEHIAVHCRAGIGRTGMVAAGVLLHCGFEPDEALEHISLKRGGGRDCLSVAGEIVQLMRHLVPSGVCKEKSIRTVIAIFFPVLE